MFKIHNPETILEPLGPYSQGVEIPPNSRILFVSGQTAGDRQGHVPAGMAEQSEAVWQRISAVLASAGMGIPDIVKVNSYLRNRADWAEYAAVRARYLGDCRPAALGLVVSDLFRTEYLLEVEVIAARPAA